MEEIYYQVAIAVGTVIAGLIINHLGVRYAEIKAKLQQFEDVLATGNDIIEDDNITVPEAKRFIKVVLAFIS